MLTSVLILYLGLDIKEVELGVVWVDDPRVEILLWSKITVDAAPITFTFLSPKSVDAVRLTGVYTLDDIVLVLLLYVLLSAHILSLDVECKDEIKKLGVVLVDKPKMDRRVDDGSIKVKMMVVIMVKTTGKRLEWWS